MKALILSGGGAKGSFQIGILSYLLDTEQIDYDIYGGTSVGSLNAAILATGPLLETLPIAEKIWLEDIKSNHSVWVHHLWYYILAGIALIVFFIICAFVSFMFDGNKLLTISFIFCALFSLYVPYYSLRKTKSLYKTDPLKHILKNNIDINKLQNSGKKLLVGAISYKTGRYHYGTEKDSNIIDWVLASSAFPVFFPMVEIDGENYVDGGVLSIDLLYEIQKLGAKEIDIILTSPMNLSLFEKFGLTNQFERTLDLLSVENLSNDIALCKLNNNVRIFMPKQNFNVSSLNFDPHKIREIYESGKKFEVNKL
jgi:NTE family protein